MSFAAYPSIAKLLPRLGFHKSTMRGRHAVTVADSQAHAKDRRLAEMHFEPGSPQASYEHCTILERLQKLPGYRPAATGATKGYWASHLSLPGLPTLPKLSKRRVNLRGIDNQMPSSINHDRFVLNEAAECRQFTGGVIGIGFHHSSQSSSSARSRKAYSAVSVLFSRVEAGTRTRDPRRVALPVTNTIQNTAKFAGFAVAFLCVSPAPRDLVELAASRPPSTSYRTTTFCFADHRLYSERIGGGWYGLLDWTRRGESVLSLGLRDPLSA
ncbi:hypothetical protein FB45DRAFT_1000199 [Roridomyces roridus]|uniref:Uncharacterized protein n=1 Tax=Roridomyces roridus TaxID=1738132 RepID=A0AAD7C7T7_9AGAR|nr:hypothetical protein FB45DRAFT_1000199 [Roridomyces roridus]